MLVKAAVFFVVFAVIAAIFGFGGLAGSFASLAQFALVLFLVLAAATFLVNLARSA